MDRMARIDFLREMAAQEPDDFLTFFMLGQEELHAGLATEAAASLERCLALNPDHTAAVRLLADAWRLAGQRDKAIAAYRQAIETAERTGDLQVAKEARALLKRLEEEHH